jgi:hypothetical protein
MGISFDINNQASSLLFQVFAGSTAPPAYNLSTAMPTYSKTFTFKGPLTLNAAGKTLDSKATSAGPNSAGGITATSSVLIGSLTTEFSTTAGKAITIAVTGLRSKASFTGNRLGGVSDAGSASITKVTINAPTFGINNLTYSGTPAANQVLYHNAGNTLVVTANRQVKKTASGKPTSIAVDGLAMHFANYNYFGSIISGDIAIGTSFAK